MMPALAAQEILEGVLPSGNILASLISGLVVLLAGNRALTRRDVYE
jgi:hypothetical protein